MRAFLAIALLLATALAPARTLAADDDPLEYRVKAAFLFNFARFVTWPSTKFADPDSPIELCVLGNAAFSEVLEATVADKDVAGRPLRVQRSDNVKQMAGCHIAYLSREASGRMELLLALAGKNILTVFEGDAPSPSSVVRFYLEERRVRFEINAAAAEREKLQVSSKLLAVAKVVDL
jgi:hypothetical protein